MAKTAWIFASFPDLPASSITVTDGSTSEAASVATGDYYLYDTSSSRSVLDQLVTAINTHTNISDATYDVTKSGKPRLYRTGGGDLGITWGSSTDLRDFVGATGDLSAASEHVLPYSKWFWSPGKRESTGKSPLGIVGSYRRDTVVAQAGDGTTRWTWNNEFRVQTYWWRYLAVARVWTSSEGGREFFGFDRTVISRGRQWKLYRNIDEDTSDEATAVSLSGPLGPYKVEAPSGEGLYGREITNVDRRSPVSIDCVKVAEFS